eukprot:4352844-Amphidinium_carterae.1
MQHGVDRSQVLMQLVVLLSSIDEISPESSADRRQVNGPLASEECQPTFVVEWLGPCGRQGASPRIWQMM